MPTNEPQNPREHEPQMEELMDEVTEETNPAMDAEAHLENEANLAPPEVEVIAEDAASLAFFDSASTEVPMPALGETMGIGAELASAVEADSAPFAGFDHDPGTEAPVTAAAPSEEEATAEPVVYRDLQGNELQAAIEATFFMHHRPISLARLRELINPSIHEEEYRTAVSNLMATYFDDSRGIELVEVANGFQFRTKTEHKDIVRRMYQIAPMKLTNAMLEVLAITAYNQPLTREGIDRIRGVDSSHLMRVLLDKKMLRIVGKSDELGRPMLYGTTKEFLELFGLRDLNSLPTLRDIEDMLPKNEVGAEISEEEALAKEMEGIVENSQPLEFNDLEMEDLDSHEAQKIEQAQAVPPLADRHGSATSDGSAQTRGEAGDDLDLPPEAAGRLPLGPEGHA